MSTTSPQRRALLASAAGLSVTGLAGCGEAAVQRFASWSEARRAVAALIDGSVKTESGWPLAQVLQHAAQSIEFSIAGFPEMKSAVFRHTVGAAAWGMFNARGAMRHSLDEPIPGAPALDAGMPLTAAVHRLLAALDAFDAHTGLLKPHFAYGELTKPAYARAHLMHLANHWSLFGPAVRVAAASVSNDTARQTAAQHHPL